MTIRKHNKMIRKRNEKDWVAYGGFGSRFYSYPNYRNWDCFPSRTRMTPDTTPNVETVEEKEGDENGDFEVDEANVVSSSLDFEDAAMAATEEIVPST
jgi:hypothetical protein